MKQALTFLLLISVALGQLPDAPSTAQPPVEQRNYPDYSQHLTWKQAATSKSFVITELAMAGFMSWDIYETRRGLRECPWLVEATQYWGVGPRPSTGDLIRRDLAVFGIISGVNLLASKYLSPWVSLGPGSAYSAQHLQGAIKWRNACRP